MPLSPGTRLGPYEIVSLLGAGAMGEVYRARDPRLGRDVAVKVLPAEFAADADRLRRFSQEARAAGALQHPNIVAVFDVGSESGTPYVVQELVTGGTLRDRLTAGALPPRQALSIAAGIAAGLAAAHEKGVVHRDLKPANVAMAPDGRPQILDFGLARMARPETDATLALDSTGAGVLVGTVGYMAPEQVRGEPSDARSDVFALGMILHEMLSGERPFVRPSAVETMHAILAEEPPPLPAAVPPTVARVIARCLEKNPALRFQSARDLAFTLEAISGDGSRTDMETLTGVPAGEAGPRRGVAPWLAALLVLVGMAGGYLVARLTAPSSGESTIRVTALSHGNRDQEPAASPDGRMIAFSAMRQSGQNIWLMDLTTRGEVRLTEGSDGLPRFAPDGGSVLFTRSSGGRRSLWRVPVVGGAPRLLIDDASDADWSPDGARIAFMRATVDSGRSESRLMIAKSDGTEIRELFSYSDVFLSSPRWSPDGRRVAVIRSANQNVPNAVIVVDVSDGSTREFRAPTGAVLSNACWDGTGDGLILVEGEGLVAIQRGASGRVYRLDARSGSYRPLGWLSEFPPVFDVLPDGRLVLSSTSFRLNLKEVPSGARSTGEGRWLTHGLGIDRQPVYSPDGKWVMFSSNRGGTLDLWEVAVETGELHRITDDPADDWDPAYSRDGQSIFWSSNRTGAFEIWTARRDGSAPRQVSRDSVDAENPTPGPGDRWLVYSSSHPAKAGIWRLGTDGSGAELLFRGATFLPEVSPDGRHASVIVGIGTLVSNLEILDLQTGARSRYPVPTPILQGYNSSGRSRWTPDGRAVVFVYTSPDGRDRLLRRQLSAWQAGGGAIDTLIPETTEALESFGISPDGRRITVAVVDWLSGLTLAEGVKGIVPPRRTRGAGPR